MTRVVLAALLALSWVSSAFSQASSDEMMAFGAPGKLAELLAGTAISCTDVDASGNMTLAASGNTSVILPIDKAFYLEQPAGTQWLRVRRDQQYLSNNILEVTIPGSDGNNNKFIYVTAADYVDVGANPRGATLELSGNDAEPPASRGVAHLFSGSNPNGRIGLNIMHPSGQVHILDVVTTTLAYTPSTGVVDLSRNLIWQPVSTTPYKIKENIGVLKTIQTGTNARAGTSVLVGGTVTVSNTSVTANTKVFTQRKTSGGTAGNLVYTVSAATSFTITSSSGTDTSTVDWYLVEFEA